MSSAYKTTDGGLSWNIVITDIRVAYTALYYSSIIQRLFLSSWDDAQYYSNDDGINWQGTVDENYLNGYAFSNPSQGIRAMTGLGEIEQTFDGGLHWKPAAIGIEGTWQPAAILG